MQLVDLADPPIALAALATAICASSNFSFASVFYLYDDADLASPHGVLDLFDAILATPAFERGLRASWVADYRKTFELGSRSKNSLLVPAQGRFESILAEAALDQAGAYSRVLRPATEAQCGEIASLFSAPGEYLAFELVGRPGREGRPSAFNSHLFTNWFYGVAWDWCFFVVWPGEQVAAVVCLTDTD